MLILYYKNVYYVITAEIMFIYFFMLLFHVFPFLITFLGLRILLDW